MPLRTSFITNRASIEKTISTTDKDYAKRLLMVVVRDSPFAYKGRRRPNLTQWARDIEIIRTLYKDTRFDKVFKWWELHSKDQYTPQVYSTMTLMEKFTRIEEAMKRQQESEPVKVKLSIDEKKIYKRLKEFRWPKAFTQDQLKEAVYISYKNYTKCLRRLSHSNLPVAKYILNHFAMELHPVCFVRVWIERCYWSVENWDDWNGSVKSITFRSNHRWYRAMLLEWGSDVFGANAVDKLMEQLNAD